MRARHVGAGLAIPLALAALAACAAHEEVISPSWRGPATVPIGTEYTPPEANRRGIEGWVLLRCIADQAQTPTDCIVIGEAPAGVGFGAAALRMTPNTSTQHIVDPGMSPPAPGGPVLVPAIFCQPIAHTRCAEMQQAAAALGARYNQIAEFIAAGHCPDARAAAAATTQPGLEHRTGRLEPALTTLMRRVKRSKDAVVRALANLRTHGFLDWLRRWEATGDKEGGPPVKQATNAYRLALPPAAEKLLGHLASPPPAPEDIEHARAARMAAVVAMVDSLPLDEQPSAAGLTGPLAAALSRLGRGLMRKECESAERSESGSSC